MGYVRGDLVSGARLINKRVHQWCENFHKWVFTNVMRCQALLAIARADNALVCSLRDGESQGLERLRFSAKTGPRRHDTHSGPMLVKFGLRPDNFKGGLVAERVPTNTAQLRSARARSMLGLDCPPDHSAAPRDRNDEEQGGGAIGREAWCREQHPKTTTNFEELGISTSYASEPHTSTKRSPLTMPTPRGLQL